jgi:hypothetical protein
VCSSAVTRRGQDDDADAALYVQVRAVPGAGLRILTGIADCDPGALDISGNGAAISALPATP